MKKCDFVKLEGVGIGKIESFYEDGDITINICEQKYYGRNINDEEVIPTSEKEYIEFLKVIVKELTTTSSKKRKDAANFNKQTEGEATKRKGKVHYDNGFIIPVENILSSHHRSLLSDAKKAKELKDKFKNEIAQYKEREKFRKEMEKAIKEREKALKTV